MPCARPSSPARYASPGAWNPSPKLKRLSNSSRTYAPKIGSFYSKRPFAGPEQVVAYLGRYTHRVAISNERLVRLEDATVHFRWKDYAHRHKTKIMALGTEEFIRCFLLHVLPKGFMRIRHFGLLANRHRAEHLARARRALDTPPPLPSKRSSLG